MKSSQKESAGPKLFGMTVPVAVTVLYLITGLLWIFFSDWFASSLSASADELRMFSSIKGWGFVLVTAGGLYALLRLAARREERVRAARCEALEQLKTSEGLFKELIENIPDLVWLKDPDGVYLHCNRRFCDFFGASTKQINGKTDADFVSREQADAFRENDRKAIENRQPTVNSEWITFAGDGHRELLETIKTPLFAEDGHLIGVLGIGRDMTERIQTEEQFRMLFESSPSGIALYRPVEDRSNFVFVDMNPAGLKHVQLSREEVIDCKVTDLFPGIEKSGLLDVFREAARTGRTIEHPLIQYQDARITQWVENKVFKLPNGLIVAVFNDITEKVTAEEQARLQALVLDQIADCVTITDLNGTITYVNRAEQELFGEAEGVRIGQSVESYGDDPEQGATQKEIIEQTRKNGRWRGEVANLRPDGKTVLMDCRTRLIYNKAGELIGMCGISTDVTERKKAEKQLQQHNMELEEFNKMAVGRELRMVELKKEINALCRELGREEPY
jgi:two-component system, sensor histidine kinase and response regulator